MNESNPLDIPTPHINFGDIPDAGDEGFSRRMLFSNVESGIFHDPGLYLEVIELYEALTDPDSSSVNAFSEALASINTERYSSKKFSDAFENIVLLFRSKSDAELVFDDDTEEAIKNDGRLVFLKNQVMSIRPKDSEKSVESKKVRHQIGRISFFVGRVISSRTVKTDILQSPELEETA